MFNFLSISGLFIFFLCAFTTGIVVCFAPKKVENVVWALFSLAVSIWGGGLFFAFSATNFDSALNWARSLNYVALFIPIFFFHFTVCTLGQNKNLKHFILAGYFLEIAILSATLVYPNLFIKTVSTKLSIKYYPEPGPLFYIFAIFFTFSVLFGFISLFRAYSKTLDVEHKKQIKLLLIAMGIGFSGGSTTFPLVFNIPIYPIGIFCPAILASTVAFSIVKFNLFGIKVIINRTVAFFLTVFIYSSSYLALLLPYRAFISTQTDIPFIVGSIIYGTLVGLTFERVRLFIQTSAYKKFLKLKYNFGDTLKTVSEKLMVAHSKENILEAFLAIQESLEIGDSYALLRRGESEAFDCFRFNKLAAGNDVSADTLFTIQSPERIIELIDFFSQSTSKLLRYTELPESIQTSLEGLTVHKKSLFLAIHSFRDLQAIFIIGQRLSEESYSAEDLSLFEVVLNQAITVFERNAQAKKISKSNENLKQQVEDEVKKKKVAIEIAQELSHKAALATLATGIAHEIRNPMASMQSHMLFLADRLGGVQYDIEDENDEYRMRYWRYFVSADHFYLAVGRDEGRAEQVIEKLKEEGYLSAENELTEKLNPFAMDASEVDLGPEFEDHLDAIQDRLKQILQTSALYGYLNMAATQYTRILYIADNMMRYGVSGGGIKKDSFTQLEGVTEAESEAMFNELIEREYLDDKGGVQEKFKNDDPLFKLALSEPFKHLEAGIQRLIQNTPGATKTRVEINEILHVAHSILVGSSRGKGIAIKLELGKSLPDIWGDEMRLQQAFFNVMFNAMQALEKKDIDNKQILIITSEAEFIGHLGSPVQGIEVIISDNGPGIAPETKEKIFDPFFTTKGPTGGKNAGLGLSILKDVIMNHSGSIVVESELGVGTWFKFYLPVQKGR